jgi:cell division septal protein FtsQ
MGGVLLFIFVASLLWGAWYVSRLPSLTIEKVTVSGGETISHDLVRTLVWSDLEGEYFRFIPKRFSWLYPRSTITDTLRKIARIKEPKVSLSSWTELTVTFSEYVPDALWCGEFDEECVFLDASGFGFARAPSLTGGSFLRLGKVDVTPVANVQAFNPINYQKLKSLVSLLSEQGWFVASLEVDAVNDAYLFLNQGGELKVALSDEPEQIVENLFTVLSASEFANIGPGEFDYIDLRFGNKVFVNELESEFELATSTENELE